MRYLSSLVHTAAAAAGTTDTEVESLKSECLALLKVLRKLPARFANVEGVFSALEVLVKWLDCANHVPLLSLSDNFSAIQDKCSASAIMELGHMEPLESLLSGHESHCHVQELAKFHERCLQGKAVDMVKEGVKPLLRIVSASIHTLNAVCPMSLEDIEVPEGLLTAFEAETLCTEVQSTSFQGLRAKVDLVGRLCTVLKSLVQLKCAKIETIDRNTLEKISNLGDMVSNLDAFGNAHPGKMEDIGLETPLLPETLHGKALLERFSTWGAQLRKQCLDQVTAMVRTDIDRLKSATPPEHVVTDAHLLTQVALQKQILENPKHDELVPTTVNLIATRELLKEYHLFGDLRKEIFESVGVAKLCIGAKFCLNKLDHIRQAPEQDRGKIAEGALQKIKIKGISLPKALQVALEKFAPPEASTKKRKVGA